VVGDFGGGGMFLAFGIVCGILEARTSGEGQVVDAAMVDGSAVLMSMMWGLRQLGAFDEQHRGGNVLDTGAPFYDTYECADGAFIALGSLEPQFYAELLAKTGLAGEGLPEQMDRGEWPRLRERFTELFKTKTRAEWCALLESSDACFAPVLTLSEAAEHPHIRSRGTIVEYDGVLQPAPAPRFSRTAPELQRPAAKPGEHTDVGLRDWGFTDDEIIKLRDAGAVR
jgi:alpha-methylacyl-CoA racemase